jgi:hypothetical protein
MFAQDRPPTTYLDRVNLPVSGGRDFACWPEIRETAEIWTASEPALARRLADGVLAKASFP